MLDLEGSTPLHQQLKEILYQDILEGKYPSGGRLPSERELCLMFDVSRITVRQALNEAEHEGWIYRYPGKGTFARISQVIEQSLPKIVKFSSSIQNSGLKPTTRVLKSGIVSADMQLMHIFNLVDKVEVANLRLLGCGDGLPMVVYDSYFEPNVGDELVRLASRQPRETGFSTLDLYEQGSIGYIPQKIKQTLEAALPQTWVAKALEISKQQCILLITSLFNDKEGRTVEYRKAYYRADRYRFYMTREL